jgi:hypothetical protein
MNEGLCTRTTLLTNIRSAAVRQEQFIACGWLTELFEEKGPETGQVFNNLEVMSRKIRAKPHMQRQYDANVADIMQLCASWWVPRRLAAMETTSCPVLEGHCLEVADCGLFSRSS